jgi:WD repeat-containing protein 70
MTAAADGTIRIWDVNRTFKNCAVVKVKTPRGRLPVTSCAMAKDGKLFSAACFDGSLQIWRHNSRFIRPDIYIPKGHEANTATSRVVFSGDSQQLITRGGDNTIKVWDLRNTKEALKSFGNLLNMFPETDVILSPDERLIVGCISAKRGEGKGSLVFIDSTTLEIVQTVLVSDGAAIRAIWNEAINQLVVGCSDFNIHALYNPNMSTKGALLCAGKKPKRKEPMDFQQIVVPHEFNEGATNPKRQRAMAMIPELPRKKGGAATSMYAKYNLPNGSKDEPKEQDPREAILAMAEAAEADPIFFGRAYAETQPKPIFDMEEAEQTPNR